MKRQRKATSDVRLDEEMGHVDELPAGDRAEHFQDHNGIAVFGKCGDFDVLVVGTIYHVGGRLWGIEDGAVQQTNLIISPNNQRRMHNNDFVGNRMDPMGAYHDFEEVREPDRLIWKAGNRQLIFHPPYWELHGEHMGVGLDLMIGGIGQAIPYHGAWKDLAQSGVAGNEHLGWAEGTITFEGKEYVLDEGWAVRERACLGKGWDVLSLMGPYKGYLWGWCFSERVKIFCFAQFESNHLVGRVSVDETMIDFGKDEIFVEPLEWWQDPLTGVTYPIHWNITMTSEKGTLEINVNMLARALYGFHLTNGYSAHHSTLGRSKGRFLFPDGQSVLIEDCLSHFEQGKATYLRIR